MWASVESGNVTEVYASPKSLTIGDVNYPRNIFELWTEAELQTLNIYTVVGSPILPDVPVKPSESNALI